MKKALSVILSVLVIFSMFGMVAAAEDLVTVKFIVDDAGKEVVIREFEIASGLNFVDRIKEGGDAAVGVPEKASTETTRFIFSHWEAAAKDADGNFLKNADGTYVLTGKVEYTANIPAAHEDTIYVAVFEEKEIIENQTFWAFIQSIFARINQLFEYFAKVFEGVLQF